MQTKQQTERGSALRLMAGTALWASDSEITEDFLNKDTGAELERAEQAYFTWLTALEREQGLEVCDRASTIIALYIIALQQQTYENGIKQGFKLAAELTAH